MKLSSRAFRAAVIVTISAAAVSAQSPASGLTFEVVSVRPTPPDGDPPKMPFGMKITQGQANFGQLTLQTLIATAFKVKFDQVIGPEWLGRKPFDIEAKLPTGATKDQVPQMLQALLADRFKMTIRREYREQSVYELVVAKGGLKMTPKDPVEEPATPLPPGSQTIGTAQGPATISQSGNRSTFSLGGAKMTRSVNGMRIEMSTISALVDFLPEFVDRPVVDKTNLKGNYPIQFDISRDAMMSANAPPGVDGGNGPAPPGGMQSLFSTALEKLGLKLEERKDPNRNDRSRTHREDTD
jgi:uncharacterized protein (TIGR03435 family)